MFSVKTVESPTLRGQHDFNHDGGTGKEETAKAPLSSLMGGNACFGERPFQPQALQTPAFQGGQLAFLRVKASIPEARLWLKKKNHV